MKELKAGDKIKWTYEHSLNSKAKTLITRYGIYIRSGKRKKKYHADWNPDHIAVVKFHVNKGNSRILERELKRVSEAEYTKYTNPRLR